MPYHQNSWHVHHRRVLETLGEKINTWRQNGKWIYANHHDPYILTVNCELPNNWVCCNGDIGCSVWYGAPPQIGWNTVRQSGWRWSIFTRMVLFNLSGSSRPCWPWITHRFITSSSSFYSDQIRYCRNSTLAIGKVGCQVGWVALIVAWLEVLVLTVNMARVVKYIR